MQKDKSHELLNGNLPRVFFKYVIPGILSALVTLLFGMFDTMFIGQNVGELGVASLNLAVPIFSVQMGVGLIFGVGGATLGAIAAGNGDPEEQNRYFTLVLIWCLLLGILELAFGVLYLEPLARLLGASDTTLAYTMDYLLPIVIASPFFVLNPALSAFVRNDNNPRLAMFSVIGCSLLNILLDFLAVQVFDWGMLGAAGATAISMTVGTLLLLAHFTGRKNTLHLAKVDRPLRRTWRTLVCGLPAFILELANGISVFLFNNRLLHYAGEQGVAAYVVCMQCSWLSGTFVAGIGNGVQPILSTNHGAGKTRRVRRARNMAVGTSLIICIVFLALCQTIPEQLVLFFVDADAELLALSVHAIRIYCCSVPFVAIGVTLGSYLQAVKASLASTAVQLARGIVLSALFVFLLPVFFDVDGIWIAPVITELLTAVLAVLLTLRLRRRIDAPELLTEQPE